MKYQIIESGHKFYVYYHKSLSWRHYTIYAPFIFNSKDEADKFVVTDRALRPEVEKEMLQYEKA